MTPESSPSIVLTSVRKTYNPGGSQETEALCGIDLGLDPGIWGLIGPNGAGKTTLLRILATVIRPSAGRAEICGHDTVTDPIAVRRCLGFLSTSTGLYERLSARETLAYFAGLYGLTEDETTTRIAELCRLLDMESFLDRRCGPLSQGQKQRVSIARCLIHDPPIFILDEPTNGLDVLTARTIIAFVRWLKERGRLVLLATHDMPLAARLCDRFAYLHRGRIFATGSQQEFAERHGTDDLEEIFLAITREADEGVFA